MKQRVMGTLCLLLTLLTACNDVRPNPQPSPTLDWPIAWVRGEPRCTCTGARAAFITNRTRYQASVTLREYENYMYGNGSRNYPRHVDDVPAGERRFLQCSPTVDDATGTCGISYSWTYERYALHHTSIIPLPARDGRALTEDQDERVNALLEGEPVARADRACVERCRGNSSACFKIDARIGNATVADSAYSLLAGVASGGSIPVARFLSALGESENVCERSDISVKMGALTNTGQACTWSGGSGEDRVTMSIPEILAGELERVGTELSLTFPRKLAHAPKLSFSDSLLNAHFGGYIGRADEAWLETGTQRGRFMVISTGARCVAVRTK